MGGNTTPKGRPVFIITKLSAFINGVNGNAPITPYSDEFCYDDIANTSIGSTGDGALGRIVFDSNGITWKFVSLDGALDSQLKQLNYSGIFDNAAAGIVTRDLTYFFYSIPANPTPTNPGVLILNPDLVYPSSYRYYAVRDGSNYITGKVDSNGNIITNFVDMDQVPVNQGSTNILVSKPEPAPILPGMSLVDSSPYIIEFFDATKTLVFRDVFYASSSKLMVNENSSDVGIVSMSVSCTRIMPGVNNSTFLYRGENVQQLGFNIYLYYSDGTTRNITYELNNNSGKLTTTSTNGNVTVSGIIIDTSAITGNGNPQEITFTYAPDPINNTTGNSLSTIVNVFILEDDTVNIAEFVPALWFDPTHPANLLARFYAVRDDGTDAEITGCLTAWTGSNNPSPGVGTYIGWTATFNLGVSGQTPETKPIGPVIVSNVNNNNYVNKATLYALSYYASTTNKIVLPGFVGIDLQNANVSAVDNGALPTHINIRNLDGNYNYTAAPAPIANILAANGGVNVVQGQDATKQFNVMVPILIEFLHQTTDTSGATVFHVTNIRVAYVTTV